MTILTGTQQNELDSEWVELMEMAKQMGFTTDEVRSFIKEASDLHR